MILTPRYTATLDLTGQDKTLSFGQSDNTLLLELAQFFVGPPGSPVSAANSGDGVSVVGSFINLNIDNLPKG